MKYFAIIFVILNFNCFAMIQLTQNKEDEFDYVQLKEKQSLMDAVKVLDTWKLRSRKDSWIAQELEELLQFDLDINATIPNSKETLLIRSINSNNFFAFEWLIEHGACVNGRLQNDQSPLLLAASVGRNQFVKKLMTCGAVISRLERKKISDYNVLMIPSLKETITMLSNKKLCKQKTIYDSEQKKIGIVKSFFFKSPRLHYIASVFDNSNIYKGQCRFWHHVIEGESYGYIVQSDFVKHYNENILLKESLHFFVNETLEEMGCRVISTIKKSNTHQVK